MSKRIKTPRKEAAAPKGLTKIQAWSLGEVRRIVFKALGSDRAEVYLFGSWARGEIRPSSDMDIAIWPAEGARTGLVSEIQEALEDSTVPYRVEVADLASASPEFRERVVKEGIKWTG